ncbi:MAG: hypothetical protein ACRD97_12040 [Nitrososphaeraceae archaeon]
MVTRKYCQNAIVTLATFFAIFNSPGENKKYENNSFPDNFKNPDKGDHNTIPAL